MEVESRENESQNFSRRPATGHVLAGRRWMSLDSAAVYADLPVKTLRRAIREGALPYAKPGRKIIVDVRDVDAWLTGEKTRVAA